MEPLEKELRPRPEQIVYANVLSAGVWLGLLVLVVTYALYVSGLMAPHVEISQVTQNWGRGVDEYLKATNSPQGWGWLGMLSTGDFLNYLGLAFLALLSVVCYLVLLPGYIRQKDWPYTVVCFLEVVVLSVAASGILGVSGH